MLQVEFHNSLSRDLSCLCSSLNDIDKNAVNELLHFADDTKLHDKVFNDSDTDQVQIDLRWLFD